MTARTIPLIAVAALLRVGPISAASAGTPPVTHYREAGDGSGAVALDANCFAVVEDEFNTLRIYEAHPGDPGRAAPLWSRDFCPALGVKEKDECDLEAGARVEDRIYWIGSHGFHKDGSQHRAHCMYFATDIVRDAQGHYELRLHGKPYQGLVKDLGGAPALSRYGLAAAAGVPPKQAGGLNIEALCATPEGHLLIGFRSPQLTGGKALLVELKNPGGLVDDPEAHAAFGDVFELDLGKNRGFRDVARRRDGYLIIAGAADAGSDFALYAWTGRKGDAPRQLPADFAGLHPEALMVYPGQSDYVQILSDDGKQQSSTSGEAKDTPLEERSFRSLWIDVPTP